MNLNFFKSNSGAVDARLLAAAIGCSLAVHAVALGGWALWENGHGGSRHPEAPDSALVQVKIQPAQKKSPAEALLGAFHKVRMRSAEQTDRARSRVMPIPAISASRVLEDPATGLVFSAYFKAVKVRLTREAARGGVLLDRDVPVRFVLGRGGDLESVFIPREVPQPLRESLQRLLSEAAPFPAFPSSIRHASIAFEVLFRCDTDVLG